MSEQQTTHEIELTDGYTLQGVTHRRVVFGKSVSAKRLLELRVDPLASVQTQYDDLLLAESIIEFGALRMPIDLTILLGLTDIDRDDLRAGRNEYRKKVIGDRGLEVRKDGVTLWRGIKIGELHYTIVEFGNRLTGRDEVDADKAGFTDTLSRQAFRAGRMISKLRTPEGNEVRGPVEFDLINTDFVDEDDVFALVAASELWRQSFRRRGGKVSPEQPAAQRAAAGAQNRVERGADSVDAAGKAGDVPERAQ